MTETLKLGNYSIVTKARQASLDAKLEPPNPNNMASAELAIYNDKKKREHLAKDLSKHREEWKQRASLHSEKSPNSTMTTAPTKELAAYRHTEASRNQEQFKSKFEIDLEKEKNKREILASELEAAREQYKKRQTSSSWKPHTTPRPFGFSVNTPTLAHETRAEDASVRTSTMSVNAHDAVQAATRDEWEARQAARGGRSYTTPKRLSSGLSHATAANKARDAEGAFLRAEMLRKAVEDRKKTMQQKVVKRDAPKKNADMSALSSPIRPSEQAMAASRLSTPRAPKPPPPPPPPTTQPSPSEQKQAASRLSTPRPPKPPPPPPPSTTPPSPSEQREAAALLSTPKSGRRSRSMEPSRPLPPIPPPPPLSPIRRATPKSAFGRSAPPALNVVEAGDDQQEDEEAEDDAESLSAMSSAAEADMKASRVAKLMSGRSNDGPKRFWGRAMSRVGLMLRRPSQRSASEPRQANDSAATGNRTDLTSLGDSGGGEVIYRSPLVPPSPKEAPRGRPRPRQMKGGGGGGVVNGSAFFE